MHIGIQLTAPNGWGDLAKGTEYYFSGHSPHGVLLVDFYQAKGYERVGLRHLSVSSFEAALTGEVKRLVACDSQRELPYWLEAVEGVSFESANDRRYKKRKRSYTEEVNSRTQAIAPLLARRDEILSSSDPLALISRLGRDHSPGQHPYRLQLWFFAYVLHNNNEWALMAPRHRIGRWDRNDPKFGGKKFGRTYLEKGSEYGWPSVLFGKKVIGAYLSLCGECKTMVAIYRRALTDVFGCKSREVSLGRSEIYHPRNEPYPSYAQFRQIVVEEFGLEQVQLTVYGHTRMRHKGEVDKGSYVSQYKNVLERVEVDAYRCEDRPRAMFSDEPLPPLIVARAICVKTGGIVGVGFSLGGEKRDAYRSMLLCMVLPKSLIARIYGIPEKMLNWQMGGMSPSMLSDRGPAGFESLLDRLEEQIPIKSIAPSYEPRSKPNIEGSNPKTTATEGAPQYVLSELNLVEMIRREVMRAVKENRSKDITAHMSEAEKLYFEKNGLVATPEVYWRYLTDRLRTSGYGMGVESAVKAFCNPVQVQIDAIGVALEKRHYSSDYFRENGCHAKGFRARAKKLTAFSVPLATRYIWMDFDGHFLELEAVKSGSSNGQDYFVPLSTLDEIGKATSVLKSRTRKSGTAAAVAVESDFKELTGVSWDAGVRRKGVAPRGRGTTTHEERVLNDRRRKTA